MSWPPPGPVVVPIDFSERCFRALRLALNLVDEARNLHAVHVLYPLSPMEPSVVWNTTDDAQRVEHVLDHLAKELADRGAEGATRHVAVGDPARTLAQYAEEIGASAVVMPSHGRTGFKRLLLGSVAENVVRHARCSVLVLRDR